MPTNELKTKSTLSDDISQEENLSYVSRYFKKIKNFLNPVTEEKLDNSVKKNSDLFDKDNLPKATTQSSALEEEEDEDDEEYYIGWLLMLALIIIICLPFVGPITLFGIAVGAIALTFLPAMLEKFIDLIQNLIQKGVQKYKDWKNSDAEQNIDGFNLTNNLEVADNDFASSHQTMHQKGLVPLASGEDDEIELSLLNLTSITPLSSNVLQSESDVPPQKTNNFTIK
ncbi:hypothetical protein ACQUW5_07205 [Legionella sp. CNM-1927-20]|uniref:hypothetical protein n=1 Tax=Legionella sp. CNM-1927-20 TaxID=3422221 RepID=UPI00403B30CA